MHASLRATQSPDLQLDAFREAGCGKIFSEQRSGAQRDRPELARALEWMRAGDVLTVWKLDRLARSVRQLIETVEGLEQAEMGFRSLTEAIDTTTPGGRLVFHIFGALAEFERSIIRERTVAGLDAARARGRPSSARRRSRPRERCSRAPGSPPPRSAGISASAGPRSTVICMQAAGRGKRRGGRLLPKP